ncbi:DUF883 domain-containing protein [Stutzerimonas nosocomialis]|uniref:DUF883 domain-containing protein n=1 Tax=Stutzerimonas nosocomialis TaxID=1056496 RepID=A0A5R9QHV7_9GAMM|nr:DUF883 domain-containing protein [Stutzerimonas nosocomialis]TLX64638.1 DUF883 domain-containing protein [Stutzerimonas nosocomialis]
MTLESTNGLPGTSQPSSSTTDDQQMPLFDKSAHKRNLQNAQSALIEEFHTLIGDTERLLKYTQNTAGTQAEELRTKLNENLARAREMLKDREGSMRGQGQAAIECTQDYVQTHPWQSVGVAAGVGFLLGLLSSRN